MLTQDEVKELIDLYNKALAGEILQIELASGWYEVEPERLLYRLTIGRPAKGDDKQGALRIKPKSVRMYFANHLMLGGLHSAMDWTDTHYIDVAEDGTITGGLISDMVKASSHGSLFEFDRS